MKSKKYTGIRLKLGFLENTDRLSLERYPEVMPQIDWHRLEGMWHHNRDERGRVKVEIPGLWGTYYICRDQACLSEADPEELQVVTPGIIRIGIILHRENLLYMGHKNGKIEITIGDIFASESHWYHQGQTRGMFVFGVKDVRECDLPRGQKVRRKFDADIQKIRKFAAENNNGFANKNDSNLKQQHT